MDIHILNKISNLYYYMVKKAAKDPFMPESQKDALITLGLVKEDSSHHIIEEIYNNIKKNLNGFKAIFRRLVLENHPDKPGGSSEKFNKIKSAYDYIMKDIENNEPYNKYLKHERKENNPMSEEDIRSKRESDAKKEKLNKEIEELRKRIAEREAAENKRKEEEAKIQEEMRRKSPHRHHTAPGLFSTLPKDIFESKLPKDIFESKLPKDILENKSNLPEGILENKPRNKMDWLFEPLSEDIMKRYNK